MDAPGLDFETWDSTKALVGKYYSPKVAKASPISFHGILGLRKQPIALIQRGLSAKGRISIEKRRCRLL